MQKVVVQHWYYRGNKCNDLELIPTDKTHKIFKKYALKIKSLGNEYHIVSLKELEGSDIISQISHEIVGILYQVKKKNPYFTNFTALLDKQHPKSYYFFRQEQRVSRLIQEEIVMVSTIFEWTFNVIPSISKLTLKDKDGKTLETIVLVDNNGLYHVSIDMDAYQAGIYFLS